MVASRPSQPQSATFEDEYVVAPTISITRFEFKNSPKRLKRNISAGEPAQISTAEHAGRSASLEEMKIRAPAALCSRDVSDDIPDKSPAHRRGRLPRYLRQQTACGNSPETRGRVVETLTALLGSVRTARPDARVCATDNRQQSFGIDLDQSSSARDEARRFATRPSNLPAAFSGPARAFGAGRVP